MKENILYCVSRWYAYVFAAIALFVPDITNATTMVATNLAQLVDSAESAFVIRIQSIETSTVAGRACDVVTGEIQDAVFGNVKTSQTLTWNQFKLSSSVALPGMPSYEAGKDYLVFLSGPGTGPGFQSPVGLGQGAFVISRNSRSGTAVARNAFMNSTLLRGLNVDKMTWDIVESNSSTRGLQGARRDEVIRRKKAGLRSGTSADLATLKEAAQFLHSQKQRGRNPFQDYLTTSPALLLK